MPLSAGENEEILRKAADKIVGAKRLDEYPPGARFIEVWNYLNAEHDRLNGAYGGITPCMKGTPDHDPKR